ncbi:C40 family peptidase [Hymenobacter psychrophilus]|uniref:Cell wall-associated hydrolase, NlpC family n=1 Tax=Hymenobacter psychrophilus TaxID=651662 RepID=A0A1H3CT55_9BACT|nr:C40 family peptidase [Hymenobacter psychrophilus]SDX56734.1 Cell wall-associated hydrolase, NlpC family [Hymenobacter psychrophilus]
MRYVWSVFLLLVALLVGRAVWSRLGSSTPVAAPVAAVAPLPTARPTAYTPTAPPATLPVLDASPATTAPRPKPAAPVPDTRALAPFTKADSIVAFALRQLGTNYCYAGTTPEGGFDCSGFVLYVFARYGVPTPHSTALLIDVGRPVARTAARPGDIVVFTGTAKTSTTPGHAGIVISPSGEPIRFVHSSSARRESGVKISQVSGTDYERRFMQVRRVL